MIVAESIAAAGSEIRRARALGRSIGLVPTMGALHAGHASLIHSARSQTDFTAVSIFVNPTQFGPNEDFSRYPRTLEDDLKVCSELGTDLVFAPSSDEMYPHPPRGKGTTEIDPGPIATILEGAVRPGHFRGVATVVFKLFQIITPNRAFFGQKDFQQHVIIQRMIDDLNLPVELKVEATVREADGLAMSSRNRFLSAEARAAAAKIPKSLASVVAAYRGGERSAEVLEAIGRATLYGGGAKSMDPGDSFAVRSSHDLSAIDRAGDPGAAVALVACRLGGVRLIDNAILE